MESKVLVRCCIKNCQKELPQEDAIMIDGNYFCKVCGAQYYRNMFEW